MKPIFILGMGAQKAGTSWMHELLTKQNNVNMGFTKEYHVWDFLLSARSKGFKAPLKNPDNAVAGLRRMMQADPDIYIKYFQSLISSNVQVTGDITPSYSVINKTGLEKVAQYLYDGGFEVKVIFLMRDPIERMWSSVRMEQRNRRRKGAQLDENFCDKRVLEYIKMRAHISRSDYKSAAQNIESVFHRDNTHFEIYENLFNGSGVERLSSFLGFPLREADFGERVNASPSTLRSESTTKELEKFLAPQYAFCRDKFPITNELWANVV
jgi:hypothetical protein